MAFRIRAGMVLSKVIPDGTSAITAGRYTFSPASPSGDSNALTMEFADDHIEQAGAGGSHPEEEVRIVSDVLSMLLNVGIARVSFRIDDITLPPVIEEQRKLQAFPEVYGQLDLAPAMHLSQVGSFEEGLLLQYVRACRAYATALSVVHYDTAFAVMLLVVSVECLSSQAAVYPTSNIPAGHTRNRFMRFIKDYAGSTGVDEQLEARLLRSIYDDLRSAFVHGGREAPGAAALADSIGRPYIKHQSDSGGDKRTPGIRWFAKIVRAALIGFVERHSIGRTEETGISRIAADRAMVRLRVRQDTERGDVLSLDDEHFDLS